MISKDITEEWSWRPRESTNGLDEPDVLPTQKEMLDVS
jgi:hypothetical protein